jgi:KDO2-lipid IV(A) lauroyltransferase
MKLKNSVEYVLFRFGLGILRLGPYRWSCAMLRWFARTVGMRWGLRRRTVVRQMQTVYPARSAAAIAELAGRVYDHLGLTLAEALLADPDKLHASVAVKPDWEILDRARGRGVGVIVATAHLGNFELGGRVLARRYPLLDVVKPLRNLQVDRFIQEQRARFGIRTVVVDRSGRGMIEHLRNNGVVSLLMDQDAGKTGMRLPFLGRPASTWTGAARVSIRTGCPVVPACILRRPDGSHVLQLAPALEPGGLTGTEQDVAEFTLRISQAVEDFILDQPEQWFWVHRRWKGAGEARIIRDLAADSGSGS